MGITTNNILTEAVAKFITVTATVVTKINFILAIIVTPIIVMSNINQIREAIS